MKTLKTVLWTKSKGAKDGRQKLLKRKQQKDNPPQVKTLTEGSRRRSSGLPGKAPWQPGPDRHFCTVYTCTHTRTYLCGDRERRGLVLTSGNCRLRGGSPSQPLTFGKRLVIFFDWSYLFTLFAYLIFSQSGSSWHQATFKIWAF